MKRSHFIQQSLALASALVLVVLFQNCSSVMSFNNNSQSTSQAGRSSGNGEGYQGKPGIFYRVAPDQKCGSDRVVHSTIRIEGERTTLSLLNSSTCAMEDSLIDRKSLGGSSLQDELLSHKEGVYERRDSKPDLTARDLILPELWCTADDGDQKLDVIVRTEPATNLSRASVRATGLAGFAGREVKRTIAGASLKFAGEEFALSFDTSDAANSASFQATVSGKKFDRKLNCRRAGKIDPVNPVAALACPTNYLMVPGLAGYTDSPFCAMKYEPRANAGVAVSTPVGTPWTNITRNQAITACQANGGSFDLIDNNQWQTLARDVELQPVNWSAGVVGDAGGIARGHSDNNPTNTLAASADDNNACLGTGQTCSSAVWSSQRRTLRLSTGDWIWDLAGNADEWLKDTITRDYNGYSQISVMPNVAGLDPAALTLFGPTGNYTALNAAPFGGLGLAAIDGFGGAIRRGGGWQFDGVGYGGVFNVYLYDGPNFAEASVSFRCVYRP